MKKTVLVASALFATSALFAQKGKVTSANNYKESGKLEKAWEVIQPTLDENNSSASKTYAWPRAWEVNADILVAIGGSKDAKVKALVEDPYVKAVEAYAKALELDVKKRNAKGIRNKLILLESNLINSGAEAYNKKDYQGAVKYFESTLNMKELEAFQAGQAVVDTAIIFNVALCAGLAEDYDKAVEYYKKAQGFGYRPSDCQTTIIKNLLAKGDNEAALAAMKAGVEAYPENQDILVLLINYYLEDGKPEQAIAYLDTAIEKDPTNATYSLTRGVYLEKLERWDEAQASYEQSVEVDDTNADAFFNLGIFHYNRGVRQNDVANAVPANDNETYEKEKAKINVMFADGLPYLEKANELKPEDPSILEALKVVYYRLGMEDKQKAIEAQLK